MRRRPLLLIPAMILIMLTFSASAYAADYDLNGVPETEYYPETTYETVYGSKYNYCGMNAVDFQNQELPYGVTSKTQTGPMEKTGAPASRIMNFDNPEDYGIGTAAFRLGGSLTPMNYTNPLFMKQADGTMGSISIPALNVNFKVRDGETTANMNKGFAHYSTTSGWNGNVGVCAHNRGCKYAVGGLKDLEYGDVIIYSTVFGSRVYIVESVNIIANNDWSYLQPTLDNRLTLTTCLANHPEVRVCVQAVAID